MVKISIPSQWRIKDSKYRLIGTRCMECNTAYFPPRNVCNKCRRKGKMEKFQFSGKGEIVSYTVIRTPPEGFEYYTPYIIGIIKLEEGPLISGQIVGDLKNIEIGKKVHAIFRKIYEEGDEGLIVYGIKFEIDE